MTHRATVVACVLAVVALLVAGPLYAADWPRFGGDPGHTNASSEVTATPISLVWKYFTGYMRDNPTVPVVADGKVFFGGSEYGTDTAHFYCVSVETGEKLWDFAPDAVIRTAPAYLDGMVYFGTEDGTVYALDATTGKARWSYKTGRSVRCNPNAANGLVYIGSSDRKLYALKADSGDEAWKYEGEESFVSSPAISGDLLYAASVDGYLHAIEKATGNVIWRRRVSDGQLSAPLAVKGKTIYAISSNQLLALDAETFGVRWQKQGTSKLTPGVAVTDRSVFLASASGWLFAFDVETGGLQWRYHNDTTLTSPPMVVGDIVVVGAEGAAIIGLDAAKGELRWKYFTEAPSSGGTAGYYRIAGSPSYANGSLYAVSDEGNLYRFSASEPDPAPPLVTLLTPAEGQLIRGWPPILLGAKVYDPGSGVNESSLALELDGKALKHEFNHRDSLLYYEMKVQSGRNEPLEDGFHIMTIKAKDYRGNAVERTWRFTSDKNLPAVSPNTQPATGAGGAGG